MTQSPVPSPGGSRPGTSLLLKPSLLSPWRSPPALRPPFHSDNPFGSRSNTVCSKQLTRSVACYQIAYCILNIVINLNKKILKYANSNQLKGQSPVGVENDADYIHKQPERLVMPDGYNLFSISKRGFFPNSAAKLLFSPPLPTTLLDPFPKPAVGRWQQIFHLTVSC